MASQGENGPSAWNKSLNDTQSLFVCVNIFIFISCHVSEHASFHSMLKSKLVWYLSKPYFRVARIAGSDDL